MRFTASSPKIPSFLHEAPHSTLVSRPDDVQAARKPILKWEPVRVVIESEPQDGVRNMAVDEALLEAALDRGECTVRWYRWREATVSLGYFQDCRSGRHHPRPLRLANRPPTHGRRRDSAPSRMDLLLRGSALEIPSPRIRRRFTTGCTSKSWRHLQNRGSARHCAGEALAEREGTFLCFGRGDPRDIVLNGHKILGSASAAGAEPYCSTAVCWFTAANTRRNFLGWSISSRRRGA